MPAFRVVADVTLHYRYITTVDAPDAEYAEENAYEALEEAILNQEVDSDDMTIDDFRVYEVEGVLE